MCQKNSPKMEPIKPHVSAPRRALAGVSHSDFLPRAESTESQQRPEQKAHPSRARVRDGAPRGGGARSQVCSRTPRVCAGNGVGPPCSACRAPNPRGAHTARGESGIPNGGTRGPRAALLPGLRSRPEGLLQPPRRQRGEGSGAKRMGRVGVEGATKGTRSPLGQPGDQNGE